MTYCPLQHNDEEDVVRLAHTYIGNPCRRWLVGEMSRTNKNVSDYTLKQYKDLIAMFTLKVEMTPIDFTQKMFAVKLGNLPFDTFYSNFTHILNQCPVDITSSTTVMIAALETKP